MQNTHAVVVFSGGQDSTVCLAQALNRDYTSVTALTFDYGQRHGTELSSAIRIVRRARELWPHVELRQLQVQVPDLFGGTSPLVNRNTEVGQYENAEELPGGVEPTFVPGRNLVFLSMAFAYAGGLLQECGDTACVHVITGVSQEDSGGYPDCRAEFCRAIETAASRALDVSLVSPRLVLRTPLLYLTKKATVELGVNTYGCMDLLALSHTCYNGVRPPCGKCHACILRARGFQEAGYHDPIHLPRTGV